jgi:lysophospholipase L1-like esterase
MKDNSKPATSFWKRLAQNITLSIVIFALCIFALELTLRLVGYGNLEVYSPDPQLYWRLTPNQQCFTKVDRKPVQINSHGTRGPEFPTTKPTNTLRILSLGDSRTFGWGLSEDETYSARLQKLLQAEVGNAAKVEVINAGVNAWSYPQMAVYLREHGLEFSPDIIVLADANLWTQFSEQSSLEFVKSFLRRVWLKNFLRQFSIYHYFVEIQLRDYYERHRSKFIPVDPKQDLLFKEEQQADPDAVFRHAIENICQLSQSKGIQPILISLPIEGDWKLAETPAPLRAKRLVAKKTGVPLVEMSDIIQSKNEILYLDADPVHFNARGNELIAISLFETLKPLIKTLKTNQP